MLDRLATSSLRTVAGACELIGGNRPKVAGRDDLDAVIRGRYRASHAHDCAGDLVEVDGLVDVLGQRSVRRCWRTRRSASAVPLTASSLERRDCSHATARICRLFLTQWWISRIVASFVVGPARGTAHIRHVAQEDDSSPSACARFAGATRMEMVEALAASLDARRPAP